MTDLEEAGYILDEVKQLKNESAALSEIALLYRSNRPVTGALSMPCSTRGSRIAYTADCASSSARKSSMR